MKNGWSGRLQMGGQVSAITQVINIVIGMSGSTINRFRR
jgi:hypothetical protein